MIRFRHVHRWSHCQRISPFSLFKGWDGMFGQGHSSSSLHVANSALPRKIKMLTLAVAIGGPRRTKRLYEQRGVFSVITSVQRKRSPGRHMFQIQRIVARNIACSIAKDITGKELRSPSAVVVRFAHFDWRTRRFRGMNRGHFRSDWDPTLGWLHSKMFPEDFLFSFYPRQSEMEAARVISNFLRDYRIPSAVYQGYSFEPQRIRTLKRRRSTVGSDAAYMSILMRIILERWRSLHPKSLVTACEREIKIKYHNRANHDR